MTKLIEPRTDFVSKQDTIVHCRTIEGATALMHALAKRFPEDAWITNIKIKVFHSDAVDDGLCYRIRSNNNGKLLIDHCFRSYYVSRGYRIVELSELCLYPDYGEIECCFSNTTEALASLF